MFGPFLTFDEFILNIRARDAWFDIQWRVTLKFVRQLRPKVQNALLLALVSKKIPHQSESTR